MLSIGIVGLPNVGKSTLFNALTKNQVLAANYPFATIEPNVGIVNVPDSRLDKLSEISSSVKTVPAACTFVDIAGIVRGASKGEGLGNKFLSHIRESNVIVQVVRAFVNNDIVHVEGAVDPQRDIEIIRTELCLADIGTIGSRLAKLEKEAKADPKARSQVEELKGVESILDKNELLSEHYPPVISSGVEKSQRSLHEGRDDKAELPEILKYLQLLTAKKFIYVFNIDESELGDDTKKKELQSLVGTNKCVFLSAETEAQLMDLPANEANELLQSLGQKESGLDSLIRVGYETLGLMSYFTSGPTESRAWTIHQGTLAPQAAGVIHGDFEKCFIKAEIVSYQDFVANNGWVGSGSAGKVRLEGKDYVVKDGDVIVFRHS